MTTELVKNINMFYRFKFRLLYDDTSKTVVGYYTENYIYFCKVTLEILNKFLKDLPDEKLAELKENGTQKISSSEI